MKRVPCGHTVSATRAPRFQPWYSTKKPTRVQIEEMDQDEAQAVQDAKAQSETTCTNPGNTILLEIAKDVQDLHNKIDPNSDDTTLWLDVVTAVAATDAHITDKDGVEAALATVEDADAAVSLLAGFLETGKVTRTHSDLRCQEAFVTASAYVQNRRKAAGDERIWRWTTAYKPLETMEEDALEDVLQDYHRIVVFFRALDRSPGGNIDSFVVRLVIESDDDQQIQVTQVYNFDGELCVSGYEMKQPPKEQLDAMKQLLLQQESRNAEFHIRDDKCYDQEATETQWSSIEILLFDGQALPVTRLHQRCVIGQQDWRYRRHPDPLDKKCVEGTKAQKDLIDKMKQYLNVKEPEDHTNFGVSTGTNYQKSLGWSNFVPVTLPV